MRIVIIPFTLLIILFAFFAVGKAFYHDDNTQDIYNTTVELNWNQSHLDESIIYNYTGYNVSRINMIHLTNIIYYGVNCFGNIAFEIAKWGIELGFRHPDMNYMWFMKWLIYVTLIVLFATLFMPFVYLIAIVYLIVVWIKKKSGGIKWQKKNQKKKDMM